MKDYIPKSIRGQWVRGYTKVSRAQVAKIFASGRKFDGFIVGSRVAAFHYFGGWYLAFPFACDTLEEFTAKLQNWEWYNANPETGKKAAIYVKATMPCGYWRSGLLKEHVEHYRQCNHPACKARLVRFRNFADEILEKSKQ